ncbi:DEAD/DEAH box helicase [Halosolutus gelatinilyticus]|uniref:DEAD/DEAH box helicase n=1 Tax=Halosolutus gelatinilyticus TaxID=2931975 RepID=UPI001FF6A51F|nr:ATP-binding protein [Halosolutus gelatinilyticus]
MQRHHYTPPYDGTSLGNIIDDIDTHWKNGFNTETEPYRGQDGFVRDTNQKLTGLQGPPGTGKTYTVAPAAVARALSYSGDDAFTGVVSAHAHDAVDEVLDDVNDVLETLDDVGSLSQSVRLLRLHPGSDPSGSEYVEGEFISHYSYSNDRETLADLFEEHLEGNDGPMLVFGPPMTIRGFVDKMAKEGAIDGEGADQLIENGNAALFQYALVDEASMMDLPLLFLLGSFVTKMGQVQLAGDHRQLPPIQQHDWPKEDRRTVENHTPALSALDIVRFLRDELEDVSYLARDPPNIAQVDDEVPLHRLLKTYRLPESIANLLSRLIYYPGDGIILEGRPESQVSRLPRVTQSNVISQDTTTDSDGQIGVPYALDPSSRLSVIVHHDDQATDINPVEQALVGAMTDEVAVKEESEADDDDLTGGVVVPYRRQRAALQNRVDDGYLVNTVEKFQGGERDLMFVSMTASDPGAIYRGADFLLDPRRFNVALSRMKRKAVLVASEAMFQTVPTDLEAFEDQSIWLRLYNEMDIPSRTPDWEGSVETFVGEDVLNRPEAVDVEIYNSTGFSKPNP